MQEGNKLSRISAIVFDLDDTLFDATAWKVAALEHAARQRGLNASAVERAIEAYLREHGTADAGLYNAVLLACMQHDSGSNIRALHDAASHYSGRERSWELYPGVLEALQELSRRYRLALIADGPVDSQKHKVQALGLSSLMRTVVYSDEIDGVRSRRPDPRPFREMRDRLELPSSQIMFVADHPVRDFKTPRFLGFLTCRVLSGPFRAEAYPDLDAQADYEITTVARLGELMAGPQIDVSQYLHLPFLKAPQAGSAPLEPAAVAAEMRDSEELSAELAAAAGVLLPERPEPLPVAAGPESADEPATVPATARPLPPVPPASPAYQPSAVAKPGPQPGSASLRR